MCAKLRRASRAVSQLYENALRPTGLRATQFTILQALSIAQEVTQATLGEILAMESTSLTRTLGIMVRRKWVIKARGEDRRVWRIRLSQSGEAELKRATPYWEKMQARLREMLGRETWDQLGSLAQSVTVKVAKGENS